MTEQTQALMEDQHRPAAAQDTPRLTGAWLRVARVSWLVLALVALAILLASLPGYALPLSEQLELSTGEPPPRTALESQGPGVVVLSTLSRLASLATALLSLALAALLFRRRFQEPAAAALSFYLLAYGVVMAGPLEFAAGYWRGDVALATTLQGALLGVPTVALFALFPNGRFVPAWTRWLLLLSVLWSVSLFFLPSMAPASIRQQSPWMIGFLALWAIGLFGAALSAQVYRYRRVSSRDERQQTKWVVYGFALWLGYMIFSSIPYYALSNLPAGSAIPLWGAVSALTWFLALSIVPASLAIAVTRHRLWDIDLVINRTLVYGALTACVVGIYALVVGGLGALFNAQGNWLITLVATGLVAVLFQPLRERLQRGVNRLLYGRRDEPFEVLERLGQRVEDTFDPEGVLPTMVETVAQTLKLPYVAIAVGQGDDLRTIESYGKPGASPHAFLLTYQGTAIGQLLAAQRAPNEAFTETEERLLRELARQAGTAVHAQQLTADVRRARQEVVASREEERRRLRRDLHDGLGPSLAAQLLKLGSARTLLAGNPEKADGLLAEVETDIEGTVAEVRRIVYDLRPPALDQLGLAGAVQAFAAACERGEVGDSGLRLTVEVEMPGELPPLPAAVEVAAYHITREALTNVVRHARAEHCTLALTIEGGKQTHLRLSILDDGQGLAGTAPAGTDVPTGIGVTAMQERAAELGGACTIDSAPGKGTRVTAVLPLGT